MKHAAFLSYSHAQDEPLAAAVQLALQRIAKPWNKRRAISVFRDKTNLAAGSALRRTIEQALEASGYFLLFASPASAKRGSWVRKEVAWWVKHGRMDRMLFVLTDGEIRWSDALRGFDWSRTTALPKLRYRFQGEPLHVDLAWAKGRDDLDLRNTRFRGEVLKLAARLRGTEPGELDGEDVREHRKTQRYARTLISLLVVLLVAAVSAGIFAWHQRNEAVESARRALAGRLAAESRNELDKHLDLSLLLAAAAVDLEPTGPATDAVFSAILAYPQLETYLSHSDPEDPERRLTSIDRLALSTDGRWLAALTKARLEILDLDGHEGHKLLVSWLSDQSEARIEQIALSPDGKHLATTTDGHEVTLWDVVKEQREDAPLDTGGPIEHLAFSADGKRLVTVGYENRVSLWDLASRKLLNRWPLEHHTVVRIGFDKNGRPLALEETGKKLLLWDVVNRRRVHQRESSFPADGTAVVFSADAMSVAGIRDHALVIQDLLTGEERSIPLAAQGTGIDSIALSGDGKKFVTGGQDGSIILWAVERRNTLGELIVERGNAVTRLAFSPDSKRLVTVANGDTLNLWDIADRKLLKTLIEPASPESASTIYDVVIRPDGSIVAAIGAGEDVRLWDAERRRPLNVPPVKSESEIASVAFSPDGKQLALGDVSGRVIRWNVAKGRVEAEPLSGYDRTPIREDYGDIVTDQTRIHSLAWGFDGKRLLSVSGDSTVKLFDLRSSPSRDREILGHQGNVQGVAFSPAGNMLATGGGRGGAVILWDASMGRPLGQPWAGYQTGTLSLAFSADGAKLAVGTSEGVFLANMDPRSWMQRACEMARRNLTCVEWRGSLGNLRHKGGCWAPPDPGYCGGG